MAESWDAGVFDRLYAADPDPWGFETSEYERRKYDATLALLPPGRRFGSALELGCSIGVFTRRLAQRCDALLAIDCAEAALARARLACHALPHVRFQQGTLPAAFPPGRFDLVVASEILYFLSPADIAHLADRTTQALRPGALVLLANWTGDTNTPCTGEAAAELFAQTFPTRHTQREETFRLDLLSADP